MKKIKIAHWIFTGLIGLMFLASGVMYIAKHTEITAEFSKLGFPIWLIYPMAVAKILGVVMIVTKFNKWLTEWAYAGIFFNLLLAVGAHTAIGDGEAIPPVVAILFILGSYFTWKKLSEEK